MKLTNFSVENFRSVENSGDIPIEQLSALVGRNESGKSNLLLALEHVNPGQAQIRLCLCCSLISLGHGYHPRLGLSLGDIRKKRIGRPPVNAIAVLGVSPAEIEPIDAWIKGQPKPSPSRPEAIRCLVEIGLKAKVEGTIRGGGRLRCYDIGRVKARGS